MVKQMKKLTLFLIIFLSFAGISAPGVLASLETGDILVKLQNSPKVYLVRNNKKLHIKTIEMFNSLGYKWSDIVESSASVEGIPRIKLAKSSNSPKVYYLTESGMKRHFPSPEIFLSYNNKWEDIVTVSEDLLNFYP